MNKFRPEIYFKNQRAQSLSALQFEPSLKHSQLKKTNYDYTPQKSTILQENNTVIMTSTEPRRVDSHAALMNMKNTSSLPDLHTKQIGSTALPSNKTLMESPSVIPKNLKKNEDYNETVNYLSKEGEFDRAVERYGQLRQQRIPVMSNLKGFNKNSSASIQINNDRDRRLTVKESVDRKDRLRQLLSHHKTTTRTAQPATQMPITASFSSIQSVQEMDDDQGKKQRLQTMVKMLNPVSEDQSTYFDHMSSTRQISNGYVQVMLNSKQEGIAKEQELLTAKCLLLEQQLQSVLVERDQLKADLTALSQQLSLKTDESDNMKKINRELMSQLKQKTQDLALEQSISQSSLSDNDEMKDNTDDLMQPSRIHHLYHELYLTDLKSELNVTSQNLQKQKNQTLQNENTIQIQKAKIQEQKKIIERYRQLTIELSKQQNTKQGSHHRKSIGDPSHLSESQRQETLSDQKSDNSGQQSSTLDKQTLMSRLVKINYNTHTDLERFSKALNSIQQMSTSKKTIKVLELAIVSLQKIVTCNQVQAFVLDSSLDVSKGASQLEKCCYQQLPFEGKNVHVLALADSDISESHPQNRKEAEKPIKTQKYLTYPVFDGEGQLYGFFQLSSRKTNTGRDKGFSNSDKLMLQLIALFFQIKAQSLFSINIKKQTELKVNQTIKVAAQISSQRTLSDLIMAVEDYLCSYLGFKGSAMLFKDSKSEMLFAINPNWNEEELKLLNVIKAKKLKRDPLNDQERMDYLKLQLKDGTRYRYLTNVGLTGQVFSEQKAFAVNDTRNLQKFIPTLDNLSKEQDAHQLLIVPLFGHPKPEDEQQARDEFEEAQQKYAMYLERVKEEMNDFYKQDDLIRRLAEKGIHKPVKIEPKKNIVGILQLINKVDQKVTAHDIAMAEWIGDLLGKGIDNCSEHHAAMSMKVSMLQGVYHLNVGVESSYQHTCEQVLKLGVQFQAHEKVVNDQTTKLAVSNEENEKEINQLEKECNMLKVKGLDKVNQLEVKTSFEQINQNMGQDYEKVKEILEKMGKFNTENGVQVGRILKQVVEGKSNEIKSPSPTIKKGNGLAGRKQSNVENSSKNLKDKSPGLKN